MGTPHLQVASGRETDKLVGIQDLMASLQPERSRFDTDRWNTLSEMIRFREQLEVYEAGEFGKPALSKNARVVLTNTRSRHNFDVPRLFGLAQRSRCRDSCGHILSTPALRCVDPPTSGGDHTEATFSSDIRGAILEVRLQAELCTCSFERCRC